jgi:hypothetical protein
MGDLLKVSLFVPIAVVALNAQPRLTLPPSGNNQKAATVQYIGPVRVEVQYSSPAVHGPGGVDRRGKIWGQLVPYGLSDLQVGNGKPDPWRAGANENTVFSISDPVTIEGQALPAGRYGLHMIPGAEEFTIIFSKNANAWGSFFYEDADDALRVKVKPHKHEYHEWLTYEFVTRRPNEATVELQWEELSIPWTIKANVNDIYISRLKRDLTSGDGFDYRAYMNAAQFCLTSNTNLDQGLRWAEEAISKPFIGQSNFDTLTTKGQLLVKLGRTDEAKKAFQTALRLPGTTSLQIHQYGRQMLAAKRVNEAMEAFKLNQERNGDAWPVHVGLARGYSAMGDTKQALEHAQKALTQAPDEINRKSLEDMVKTLSAGQPVSQ